VEQTTRFTGGYDFYRDCGSWKNGRNQEIMMRIVPPFELFYSSNKKKRVKGGGKRRLPF